jgi:hypothetical protein
MFALSQFLELIFLRTPLQPTKLGLIQFDVATTMDDQNYARSPFIENEWHDHHKYVSDSKSVHKNRFTQTPVLAACNLVLTYFDIIL